MPVRAFAPGRVNLIGEHTDYNGGLALPFAIDRGVTVTAAPIAGDEIEVHADDLDERFVHGCAAELSRAGIEVRGARLEIRADLPRGAGLSSSAALTVALCLALGAVAGSERPGRGAMARSAGRSTHGERSDRIELARLASRVENDWVGAPTGLLDQLAILFATAGHASLIAFRELDVEQVPLELGEWTLAVMQSGAEHAHGAAGGYAERRAQCDEAARLLGIETLSEAGADDVDQLPAPLAARARHVLDENARVRAAAAAIEAGDMPGLAELLDESHRSLRDLYEASVPEVEATVGRMKAAGAAGARMVGGSFGGAVLGLFRPGTEPPAGAMPVRPAAGARLL